MRTDTTTVQKWTTEEQAARTKAAGFLMEQGIEGAQVTEILRTLQRHGIKPAQWAPLFGNLTEGGVPQEAWVRILADPKFDNKGANQFLKAFVQGGTMGWADEGYGLVYGPDRKALERTRTMVSKAAHPVANTAVEIAGGAASALSTGGAGATALTARGMAPLAATMIAGAGSGALAGAAQGAGDAPDMARTGSNAVIGGVAGGVLGGLTGGATHLAGGVISRLADAAFPGRVMKRELTSLMQDPQLRRHAAEVAARGDRASVVEMGDVMLEPAKVAAYTAKSSTAAAEAADETVKRASARLQALKDRFDMAASNTTPVNVPLEVEQIYKQVYGRNPKTATTRELMDLYQILRNKLRSSNPKDKGYNKADAKTVSDYLGTIISDWPELRAAYGPAIDMLERSQKVAAGVTATRGSNSAGRMVADPGVAVSATMHGGRPTVFARQTGLAHGAHEAPAKAALDFFNPAKTQELLAMGDPNQGLFKRLMQVVGSGLPAGLGGATGGLLGTTLD